MGSVKHTVSVKCVQVDRSGRIRRAAGSTTGSTWRRDSEEREAGQPPAKHATRRTTAAQANGKNDALRFTVGCSTLTPKGRIASHAGTIEHVSLLDAP
ncbi:hypothetical protein BOC38_12235 [Burkholderia pseudomallei]|nr:hypothetical protein BOC38_12235 [Burkholderia pseudomallei]